jgi:hypothetical protein
MDFLLPRRSPAATPPRAARLLPLLAGLLLLPGCDYLGIESASAIAARKDAEGKAIGAGCRHAARSVEQCYLNNRRADKAAVFAGWKEMNDYMRENGIEAVPPPPEPVLAEAAAAGEADAPGTDGEKAAVKSGEKAGGREPSRPSARPAGRTGEASAAR